MRLLAQLIISILGSSFTVALTLAFPVPVIGFLALLMLAVCVLLRVRARRELIALREALGHA